MPFDEEDDRPPAEGVPGLMRRISRAAASSVPIVGAPFAELVDGVLAPVVNRQRDDWLANLARRLRVLEEAGLLTREDLQSPAFVEATVRAMRQAAVDSSSEKRDALRNAVLNTALGRAPGSDTRQLLLRCVDELTPTHLQILKLIRRQGQRSGTEYAASETDRPLSYFISREVPELAGLGQSPLADSFCRDLINRGVVVYGQGSQLRRPGFLEQPLHLHKLTDLGEQLLEFITAPPESE